MSAINGVVRQECKNILNKVELVVALTFFMRQCPCRRSRSRTKLWIGRTKEFRIPSEDGDSGRREKLVTVEILGKRRLS